MDSFLDTTSNNETEVVEGEKTFVSTPNELSCDKHEMELTPYNAFKSGTLNLEFKERLQSARNHLKRIEKKKHIIDKRQVNH